MTRDTGAGQTGRPLNLETLPMFIYLIQAACGLTLIATGFVVVGSAILFGAGLTAAIGGTDEDSDDE